MTKSRIRSPRNDRETDSDPSQDRGKRVSIEELAVLTGFHRDTIKEWIDAGLPAGSGGRGIPYSINVRDFIEWRVQRAVAAAKPLPRGSEYEWMGETDPKKIFQAQLALVKAATAAKEVVPRAYVLDVISRTLNAVRVAISSLPDRLYREKSGFPKEQVMKWREEAAATCRASLEAASAAIEKAMNELSDPDDDDAEPGID